MCGKPGSLISTKRKQLTLEQISNYDDILTDSLVDRVYYWTTIPKNRTSYRACRGIREEEVAKIIHEEIVVNNDITAAQNRLLALQGLKRFAQSISGDTEHNEFLKHMCRYLSIYLSDCPFEVNSTNRYTISTHEASLTARRHIQRNEVIKYLVGIQVAMTPEEEQQIADRKKDFSIIITSRRKRTSLFMGPARFANHDCNANARLVTSGLTSIQIVAARDISVGEEITVSYSDNYFGDDNCECLCRSCEEEGINGWEDNDKKLTEGNAISVRESIETDPDTSHLLRSRRFQKLNGSFSSRSPYTPTETRRTRSTSSRKRKRDSQASSSPSFSTSLLATPPHTPSKRQKTMANGVIRGENVEQDKSARLQQKNTVEESTNSTCPVPESRIITNETADCGLITPPTSQDDNEPKVDILWAPESTPLDPPKDDVKTEDNEDSQVHREKSRIRIPGDYTLTPSLLAQPASAWVMCSNCDEYFVQENAYAVKSSCPRCERHSKLYGYIWPKTKKEHPKDKEERVTDHRTIHRLLAPTEEAMVCRKSGLKRRMQSTSSGSESVSSTPMKPEPSSTSMTPSAEIAPPVKRGRGRPPRQRPTIAT